MIKLDDDLLKELGLESLPKEEKTAFLRHMYETLEMRVGTRLAERMNEQQMAEFEQFIKTGDEQGALKWLEANFPNYKEVVAEEFEKLKGEVRPIVPQILAASQAQVGQRPAASAPQMQQAPRPVPGAGGGTPMQQSLYQQPQYGQVPSAPQFAPPQQQVPVPQGYAPQGQPPQQSYSQQPAYMSQQPMAGAPAQPQYAQPSQQFGQPPMQQPMSPYQQPYAQQPPQFAPPAPTSPAQSNAYQQTPPTPPPMPPTNGTQQQHGLAA